MRQTTTESLPIFPDIGQAIVNRLHLKHVFICMKIGIVALSLTCLLAAQPPTRFEAASVKLHPAGDNDGSIGPHPGGFAATGVSLRVLIQVAFRLKDYQVAGGPDWIGTDRYDILATAPEGFNPTQAQLKPMLQALLTDRFQLKIHRETRELPAFALVPARNGSKLRATPVDGNKDIISVGPGNLTGQGITMAGLADALAMESDRAIVDHTGMAGQYDVALRWTPEAAEQGTAGTSLFTAIQEQLGLRLESTKTGVEVFVIDSAQKASSN